MEVGLLVREPLDHVLLESGMRAYGEGLVEEVVVVLDDFSQAVLLECLAARVVYVRVNDDRGTQAGLFRA